MFGAVKSVVKQVEKLIRPSIPTADAITQHSPKTPSRLRRSETGDIFKTPGSSRLATTSGDLHKTPSKLVTAPVDKTDANEDEAWRAECAKYEDELDSATTRGEHVAQGNLAWKLGNLYKSHGAAIDAMTHFETAKDVMEKLDEFLLDELDFNSASLQYQMGITTRIFQDIVQAQVYFKEAIKNALVLNDRKALVDSYLEMGYCLFRLEQWLQALDYYNSYMCVLSFPLPSSTSLHSSLRSFLTLKIFASLLSTITTLFPRSELVSESNKVLTAETFEALAWVCHNIAVCANRLGQPDLAKKYVKIAINFSQDTFPPLYIKASDLLSSINIGPSPTASATLEPSPSGSALVFKPHLKSESPWNSDTEGELGSSVPKLSLGIHAAKSSGATSKPPLMAGPSSQSGSTASLSTSTPKLAKVHSDDEATKSSKGDDSDDDWANDFDEPATAAGGDGKAPLKMQLLLSENIESNVDEVAPYKLLPDKDINIVTVIYPKPSILYSMKTTTGHNQLSETDLDAWLQNLILKNRSDLLSWKERQSELAKDREAFYNVKMKNLKPMTREWCYEMLGFAHSLCSQGFTQECWKLIVDFFNHIKTYLSAHKSLKGARLTVAGNLAFIASRLWTPALDSEFKKVLAVMGRLAPLYTITSKIMLAETLAHHFTGKSTIMPLLTEAYEDAEKELKTLDKQLQALNATSETTPPVDNTKKIASIRRSSAHCREMQARVLANINLFFLDRSMLTTRRQQSLDETSDDDYGDDTYLCDDETRIDLLLKLYPLLENNSFDKAKAALALGLSYSIAQDYDLAERLLFECVYMLDTMPSHVPGMKPIVSEIGSSALTAYGQVLADNYKYKYSVPAIDGALLLCDMRGRVDDYYALLRIAARSAQTAGDLPRAIDLYTEIVEHYRIEQRINEAVYVNELLCTMHIENGSFQQAITCLQRASESLPDYARFFDETAPKNSSFDPGFLRLQLQTAKTLLSSYNWDKAIDLLEQMSRYRQPAPLMVATYELLARAFLKKRSFGEADSWLDTWRDYQKEQLAMDGRLLARRYSVSAHNANMTYDVAYYALKAKNCFHANKFAEALDFIDKAILFSSATRLASLGSHYYLRGRILRRLCRIAFSMPFPTTLKPEKPATATVTVAGFGANPTSPRAAGFEVELPAHVFERPSDLLQECVSTYRQAYNYFKLTGDDCKIAKALSDMAEAYLEFLFWPVASAESTFEDVSTFPLFKVSMIATNAREEQRQNVINLDRKTHHHTVASSAPNPTTHHMSHSHPVSAAHSGTSSPANESEGENKPRISVDKASRDPTPTPGGTSPNDKRMSLHAKTTSPHHKRSQSAMSAPIPPLELSQGSSSSPRDKSPEPNTLAGSSASHGGPSNGPGSGKLPGSGASTPLSTTPLPSPSLNTSGGNIPSGGDNTKLPMNPPPPRPPAGSTAEGKASRHRSDRMKKKVSTTKITTVGAMATTSNPPTTATSATLVSSSTIPSGTMSDTEAKTRHVDRSDRSSVNEKTLLKGKKDGATKKGNKDKLLDSEDDWSASEAEEMNAGEKSTPMFSISLKTIENAAKLSLEIATYTGNLLMAINGYLNMAEIRYLEGKVDVATSFWQESADLVASYFLNGSSFILSEAAPSFLQKFFVVVKRTVRFLFFLPKPLINRNLHLVDLFLQVENDLEQQLKKAVGSQVFGTYVGSDASLPRSMFSLKLQKKYRTERTSSTSQLGSAPINAPNASTATAVPKEEKPGLFGSLTSAASQALSGGGSSNNPTSPSKSPSLANLPDAQQPPRTEKEREEIHISRSNAALIWGYYFYLRQQQKRYGEGKLTREELRVRYTKSLKMMQKLASVARSQETEYIKEWNKRITSVLTRKSSRMLMNHGAIKKSKDSAKAEKEHLSASNELLRSAERERTDSMAMSGGSPMKTQSFEEIVNNRNEKLAKLVYILQLDDRLVQYVPSTGRRCVQLIGKREQLANSTSPRQVPTHVFMKIHLLDMREDFVTLAIPSDMTLNDVISFLLERDNWDDEVNQSALNKELDAQKKGTKSTKFFQALLGGLGGAAPVSAFPLDKIDKIEKSTGFYDEFRHLLSLVGDETSEPTVPGSLILNAGDMAASPRGSIRGRSNSTVDRTSVANAFSGGKDPTGRSSPISEARPPSLKTISESDSSSESKPHTPSKTSPRPKSSTADTASSSSVPPSANASVVSLPNFSASSSTIPSVTGPNSARNNDDISSASGTSPNNSGATVGITSKSPTRPQTVPISMITLAKRKEGKAVASTNPNGNLIPLRSKLHKKVYESFSNQELARNSISKPLNVFLYLSARVARSGAFNASVANTIHFSDEVSAYLHGLAGTMEREMTTGLEPILLELASLFAPLLEILPLSKRPDIPYNLLSVDAKTYWKAFMGELDDRNKVQARTLDAQDSGSGGVITRCPLSIICSKYMHVIPWELFLPTDSVLRYFALEDAAGRPTRMAVKHNAGKKVKRKVSLSFMQCFYSQSFRNIQQQEGIRKSWILQNVNNHLNLTTDRYAADYSGDNSPIFPFHAPTVTNPRRIAHYRSKYKHITFVDLWNYAMKPESIAHVTENVEAPVMILSYSDLLEMSTSLLSLTRSKRAPTFVFIPDASIKEVIARLGKRHAAAMKADGANTEDGYQFLMNLVMIVSAELAVPIVVINPPAL